MTSDTHEGGYRYELIVCAALVKRLLWGVLVATESYLRHAGRPFGFVSYESLFPVPRSTSSAGKQENVPVGLVSQEHESAISLLCNRGLILGEDEQILQIMYGTSQRYTTTPHLSCRIVA